MQDVRNETADLLAALDRGQSIPSSWYTDPAIAQREEEKIFRKTWQYIGFVQKLRNVGDYITGRIGKIPVVVVRNQDGLEGFVNVCRHRKHEVMKGCGNAKIMQCPYHAWTYDLHGRLKSVPRSDRESLFRTADYPLLPIRVEALGPFVFANADENCKSLETYFGPILDVIANSGVDVNTLELYSRDEWEVTNNWKTMLENYLECYHCPLAHPGFSATIDVDQDAYKLEAHDWFLSHIGNVRPAALEGKVAGGYDPRGSVTEAQYHVMWPNTTININPGFPNLSIDVWLPDGPNLTRGISEHYFAPNVDKSWAEEMLKFDDQVSREDEELTNSVQRGLAAGTPESGRLLTNSEHLIVQLQRLVVKSLAQT